MARVFKMARVRLVKVTTPDSGEVTWREPTTGEKAVLVWREVKESQAGTWFGDYRLPNGKRVRKALKAQSKGGAEAWLSARQTECNAAEILGDDSVQVTKKTLFSTFVDETFLPAIDAKKRPATHRCYKLSYSYAKPIFGERTLRSVKSGDIESFQTTRLKTVTTKGTPPSNASVNIDLRFLSSVFSMAERAGLVAENPVSNVELLDEDNEGRDFSYEEQEKIFKHLADWVKPIVTFALHTGMRVGEIASLEWSRVKRDEGFIGLGKKTKGKYSREVPINSEVEKILAAQWPGKLGLPYVFTNPSRKAKGKHYKAGGISKAFHRAVVKAGLPSGDDEDAIVFHSTRHCFVSRAFAAGILRGTIRDIVGH